jgi:hypothetical protein
MMDLREHIHALRIATYAIILSTLAIVFPQNAFAAVSYSSVHFTEIKDDTTAQMVHVRVSISGESTAINAAEVILAYDPEALQVDHIDSGASDFHFEVPTSDQGGVLDMVRGNTIPLTEGDHRFIDIYFARVAQRRAYINLLPATVVTASDGEGTNVFDGQLPKLLL